MTYRGIIHLNRFRVGSVQSWSTLRSAGLFSSTSNDGNCPEVKLSFHRDNSLAVLTLCNPKRRNALTFSMMEQLDGHLTTLERWSKFGVVDQDEPDTGAENNSRAIILTGSEGNFCSGLDLHEHAHSNNHHLQSGSQMNLHMTQFTNRLHSLPVPSIAAIDGHAIGGGAELSTCTDFVILSRCARVQFVHVMRGASPGWGGGRRLVNRVGRAKALKMLLLGECILGEEEAQVFSFADGVGQEGESAFDAALRLVAEPILKLPCSKAIRAVKSMVSAADGDGDVVDRQRTRIMYDTNLALAAERQAFLSVWGGDSNLKQINKTKESLKKKKNPSLR